MDETFNERIDTLRKKSRFLLAQVDKNSKKLKKEIKKLYSQNLTLRANYENNIENQNFCHKRNAKSWHLRNDSSGVGAILHPDYSCNIPKHTFTSMPTIPTSKRVLISSKKHCEEQCCSKNVYRKPVKECYCYSEIKKKQLRSSRTQHKQDLPCKHCRSYADARSVIIKEDTEKPVLTSPISCETLRRVQKIDYTPKSQFLRNVRSKVSLLQTAGDCPETCIRSPCYHELVAKKNMYNVDTLEQSKVDKESQTNNHLTKFKSSSSKVSKNLESSEAEQSSETDSIDKSNKDAAVSLKKQSRPKLVTKRTLTTKKSVPEMKKTKSNARTSIKGKRPLQSLQKGCSCPRNNKAKYPSEATLEKDTIDSKHYQHTICANSKQKESDAEYLSDEEVMELRKFREQNYFDTHGSSHTLKSSRSSGSLEQFLLNDRLFPEPTRKIHKKDLVVTMPACATLQRKRMHYFPRYIIRQDKNNCNTDYKKKRCQSCPLTGHAIDLGITKIRSPLNSLALKYQKRLP